MLNTLNTANSSYKYYLNHLKVLLICLVAFQHSASPFAAKGGFWFIKAQQQSTLILPLLGGIGAAFVMGLFFFIAGFFTFQSYRKHGAQYYLTKRPPYLLLPALLIALVIMPPLYYFAGHTQLNFWHYFFQDYLTYKNFSFGHGWFLVQLTLYSLGFILFAHLHKLKPEPTRKPPGHLRLLQFTLLLGVLTFLVRFSKQDVWYCFHIFELFHVPQYILAFAAGILFARHNWLDRFSSQVGKAWLYFTLVVIVLFDIAAGFLHWFNYDVYIFWQAFVCVGMSIGLLVLFRDYLNKSQRFFNWLSKQVYRVYVLHLPIVVAVQVFVVPLHLNMWIKIMLIFILSLSLSFAVSGIIKFLITTPTHLRALRRA